MFLETAMDLNTSSAFLSKPRQTRASKPKVKTGCITCKFRRVKCDEAKPTCKRCAKFDWVCEGYPSNFRRGRRNPCTVMPAKPASMNPTLPQEPVFALFDNENESRYFRIFCDTTIFRLAGHYDPNLWDPLILQASTQESTIRHIVIAVAALDITSMTSQSSSELMKAEEHHRFALKQYDIAIKEMRENVSSGKQDLRATLIASILIICFEAFHGNFESAVAQVHNAQYLLAEWTATQTTLFDEGFSSPRPYTIDDELVRTFHHLEIQTLTYTDSCTVERHIRLKDCGLSCLEKMPSEFHNIREAQLYGKVVIRRAVHFMAMSWMYDVAGSMAPDTRFSLMDRVSNCSKPEGFIEQDKYLKELLRWHSAFLPLLQKARTRHNKKEFFAATCLQLHYLITYIGILSALSSKETFADSLTSIFVEVIALSKVLIDTYEECKFTYAFRAVYPLDVVAKKCRDPTIRREAIKLLLSKPRRELFWDSIIAAKVCLWVVKIEEEGMVGRYVSEESRLRGVGLKFGEKGKLHVWGRQPNKGHGASGMILREAVIAL